VDFRDLAKELAAVYKTRIELHQIGVRDKAKKISGIGPCGQKLCCSRFLNDFDSVSISMAKNQNLSLNPTKINGLCGRLLCCLKYENQCYTDCKKNLPKVGDMVETEIGNGKVISVDILRKKYKIDTSDKGIIEIDAN
jgi:cell fate regulator YaaT (PSP1 superfamily)